MGFIDTVVGIVIIIAFILLLWSRIYSHEKEHISPLVKKIKGWFNKEEGDEGFFDPTEDFELSFKGQM